MSNGAILVYDITDEDTFQKACYKLIVTLYFVCHPLILIVEGKLSNDKVFCYQVKNWVKELKKMLGSDICLAIAGNKVDLEKDRNVAIEEAEE